MKIIFFAMVLFLTPILTHILTINGNFNIAMAIFILLPMLILTFTNVINKKIKEKFYTKNRFGTYELNADSPRYVEIIDVLWIISMAMLIGFSGYIFFHGNFK